MLSLAGRHVLAISASGRFIQFLLRWTRKLQWRFQFTFFTVIERAEGLEEERKRIGKYFYLFYPQKVTKS